MSSIPFDSSGVFIAGLWRPCASGETLPLFNPSDGSLLAQIARGAAVDIEGSYWVAMFEGQRLLRPLRGTPAAYSSRISLVSARD